ncbi:3-oxo-tetronate kinase [Azohydromonas lata]|uniref:3-oxo-tetronate kinase n=1 Tax=Azohydromonas lata TaxID=45677 RepID=A0ABU5ID23_9BURK|nr:3-oxo-tetronate kinase [Azohydromonas lata]MDZ5456862.1 3-oxo-tetronate kinase [Azohydromonas lata]
MKLACIADDFTGATDLANNLVRAGMRVVQTIGVPADAAPVDADAVVVALKSRTIAATEAVAESLAALRWLLSLAPGDAAPQVYFKYCSTFDSTAQGNIGPVSEALMDALGCALTIATPAFPDNGRSVFKGHLFVGDVLLSESGMQHHPLTPMTDPNLVRVLQSQCTRPVGLVEYRTVLAGAQAIRQRLDALRAAGTGLAIVDAVTNEDLMRIGEAVAELPLVTAGSGLATGLPPRWGFAPNEQAARLPAVRGRQAIVAGSCSVMTNCQVRAFIDAGGAALAIDPLRQADGADVVGEALAWAREHLAHAPVLIYSTAEAGAVKAVQQRLGAQHAGELVERCLADVACGLVELGVGQLVVAGGETSGACVQALGIESLQIGPQIDPGVPWCHAHSTVARGGLHVALKSGNFGGADFFSRAFGVLAASPAR